MFKLNTDLLVITVHGTLAVIFDHLFVLFFLYFFSLICNLCSSSSYFLFHVFDLHLGI